MIEKYCSIAAFDGLQQNVFVLPVGDIFEKTASIVKTAQVSEEIAKAVEEIQPEAGHRYLLVNALGAYEFWGPNKNTDAFPETGLKFGGEDYGFRTFMAANNYVHHDNKDPLKKVGTVKCAHYNDRMHRVELLIDTDLKKLAERAPAIAEKVGRGEPVDLSMGCKCDYDIATCCGNKAANRSEYCFPGDTHVLDGLGRMKFIRDVRPGDEVYSHVGVARKVLAVSERPVEEEIIEVDLYGHRSFPLRATADHRILAIGRNKIFGCTSSRVRHRGGLCKHCGSEVDLKPEWKAAKDLAPGDCLLVPIPRKTVDPNLGMTGEAMRAFGRLLGYYISGGNVSCSAGTAHKKGFALSFGSDEGQLVEDVARCLSAIGRPPEHFMAAREQGRPGRLTQADGSVKVYERVKAVTVRVNDSHLGFLMQKFAGSGARTKVLSREVLEWPVEVQREIVAGWILGDGSKDLNPSRGTIRSATASAYLASQMRILMMRCGACPSVHLYRRTSNIAYQEIFYVNLGDVEQDLFPGLRLRWNPIGNHRFKNNRLFQVGDYMVVPIRSAKRLWLTGKVYNLEVDGEHTYTANFMAVHNCDCLRKHGGQIMEDGRRVVAYTPHPKFFDISYVEKGADVTAKSLHYIEKAAADISGPDDTPHHLHSRTMACPDPTMHESVSCGPEYDIPEFPQEHLASVRRLEAAESEIGPGCLRKMASCGLPKALSTASHFGVVLRPEEYQYLTLCAMGEEKLADDLRTKNAVIDPGAMGTWFDPSLKTIPSQVAPENFDAKVAELLADVVPDRSIYEPFFSARLRKVSGVAGASYDKLASRGGSTKEAAGFMTPELAAALALGYLIYRKGMSSANTDIIQKAIHDPAMAKKVLAVLIPLVAAGSVVDKMISYEPPTGEKAAGLGTEWLLPIAGSYLYSAHARQKAQKGRPLSAIEHMALDYPLPIALGGVLGIKALKHRMGRTMAKSSGKISYGMKKEAIDSGMVLALGSGIYRPRLSGAIGYLVDLAIGTAAAKSIVAAKRALTGEKV